jgi:hypothetical protein
MRQKGTERSTNCRTGLDRGVGHFDEEHECVRRRRADHVLRAGDEVDDSVVELRTAPAVARLVVHRVPVKHLRDVVRHRADGTAPPGGAFSKSERASTLSSPVAAVNELGAYSEHEVHTTRTATHLHEWVDVQATPPTPRDDLVGDHRNLGLALPHGRVWVYNQR